MNNNKSIITLTKHDNGISRVADALLLYIENPSPMMRMNLNSAIAAATFYEKQKQAEMEERIAENILSKLSISADTKTVVKEISTLREELKKFESMFQ